MVNIIVNSYKNIVSDVFETFRKFVFITLVELLYNLFERSHSVISKCKRMSSVLNCFYIIESIINFEQLWMNVPLSILNI